MILDSIWKVLHLSCWISVLFVNTDLEQSLKMELICKSTVYLYFIKYLNVWWCKITIINRRPEWNKRSSRRWRFVSFRSLSSRSAENWWIHMTQPTSSSLEDCPDLRFSAEFSQPMVELIAHPGEVNLACVGWMGLLGLGERVGAWRRKEAPLIVQWR